MATLILRADASRLPLADGSVHCAFTSPPYWGLRKYAAHDDPACIGLEATPDEWAARLVGVFREVRRALRDDATLFVNCGDAYESGTRATRDYSPNTKHGYWSNPAINLRTSGGFPTKCLIPLPWILAFAMIADGWILRSWIPWLKASPMPESVTDRPSKACEVVLMFSKSASYFWDGEAVKRRSESPDDDRKARARNGQKSYPTDWVAGVREGSQTYPFRNFRQSDLFMDSLRGLLVDDDGDPLAVCTSSEPSKMKHYAAFPPKLVEAFIPACVPKKCCPKCGAGWRRVVEKGYRKHRPSAGDDPRSRNEDRATEARGHGGWKGNNLLAETKTVGFQPGCSCNETRTVPGILLDPFSGAGSSAIACVRQGRRYVGVELSAEYCDLSRRRIAKFLRPTVEKPMVETAEVLPLFA